MKKLLLCSICFLLASLQLQAQEENKLGYFNSLSIGANIGTTGLGIDVATPIGQYLSLRAGVTFMPNFSYSDKVDVSINPSSNNDPDAEIPSTIEAEGSIGRTAGEILLNVYPFKRSSFFITGGAVFGGNKVVKIKGHSDDLAIFQELAGSAGIEIGDYRIPIDEHGNISGGIKVSSFRPYLGLGFGRIVPKSKRIGLMFELGVQFHGGPEVYTDYGDLSMLKDEADNDFTKIFDELTIYPVMRLRFCGKIF